MTGLSSVREAFVDAATGALAVLKDPAVASAWSNPSVLAGFSVSGLAGHLASQVLFVPQALDAAAPSGDLVTILGHYSRVRWIGAGLDEEINVGIRRSGEFAAQDGPAAVVDQVTEVVAKLPGLLARQPDDRRVSPPAGPWSLQLDDFLITRMMEIVVHGDDLAVSVGIPAPAFSDAVVEPVIALLVGLAKRRHGAAAVVRALSRAERAPASISAF